MKARLNLTIDEDILSDIKSYAEDKNVSVSELVEEHFKNITSQSKRKNIFDLMKELPTPEHTPEGNLTTLFYEEQSKKYGF